MQKRTFDKLTRWAEEFNARAVALGLTVTLSEFNLFEIARDGKRLRVLGPEQVAVWLSGYEACLNDR